MDAEFLESLETPEKSLGKALIVDDETINLQLLEIMLKHYGYEVVKAENGIEAIEQFQQHQIDIVFMDIVMPEMDGYQATKTIKGLSADKFVPVIFLSAISNEKALAKCIEVGGDDFLTKPYNGTVLLAKLKAMQRIRTLLDKMHALNGQMQRDEEIAEKVFSGVVSKRNIRSDYIHGLIRPAGLFSGDMLLTDYTPMNDIYILLGDFTGHGLAAALGAIPTSDIFRTMTKKGFSGPQILATINNKLADILPTGVFLAAQLITISHELDHISLCNCGMPDILRIGSDSQRILQRFESRSLPLGISAELSFSQQFEHIPFVSGERILLCSDGVIEARNPQGVEFSQEQLEQVLIHSMPQQSLIETIIGTLNNFCKGAKQDDDISLVEVICRPQIIPEQNDDVSAALAAAHPVDTSTGHQSETEDISFRVTVRDRQLCSSDPVPAIINQLEAFTHIGEARQEVFTILTELYINALDHGVLGLDSALKESAEGFARYYTERERRLNALQQGHVGITVHAFSYNGGGRLEIHIEDSGTGFPYQQMNEKLASENTPSGRGIFLIKNLCNAIEYLAPGNRVKASYHWTLAGLPANSPS